MICPECNTEMIQTSKVLLRENGQFTGYVYSYACTTCEILVRKPVRGR